MSRQYKCIELKRTELLSIREVIRPYANANDNLDKKRLVDFCEKLYAACIRMEARDLEEVNISLSREECLIINHFIGGEDFEGSLAVLRQTWAVLYEHENDRPVQYEALEDDLLDLTKKVHAEGDSSL